MLQIHPKIRKQFHTLLLQKDIPKNHYPKKKRRQHLVDLEKAKKNMNGPNNYLK
jgi:hypothetical protein